jgi:hypothetical protein
MSLFSGMIWCANCGNRFKRKKEVNTIKYIDSGYDRKISNCPRIIIEEDILWEFVYRHYPFQTIEKEQVKDLVKRIEVKSKNEFTIYFKDGTKSEKGLNFFRYL